MPSRIAVAALVAGAGCGRLGYDAGGDMDGAGTTPGADGTSLFVDGDASGGDSASGGDGAAIDGPASAIPNDECASPYDMTGGGTFQGDTCGATDSYDIVGCGGTSGAPDLFFSFRFPGTYEFLVSAGFDVQPMSANCMGQDLSCAVTTLTNGGGFGYTVVVEKLDGGCGPFTLTINYTP